MLGLADVELEGVNLGLDVDDAEGVSLLASRLEVDLD